MSGDPVGARTSSATTGIFDQAILRTPGLLRLSGVHPRTRLLLRNEIRTHFEPSPKTPEAAPTTISGWHRTFVTGSNAAPPPLIGGARKICTPAFPADLARRQIALDTALRQSPSPAWATRVAPVAVVPPDPTARTDTKHATQRSRRMSHHHPSPAGRPVHSSRWELRRNVRPRHSGVKLSVAVERWRLPDRLARPRVLDNWLPHPLESKSPGLDT